MGKHQNQLNLITSQLIFNKIFKFPYPNRNSLKIKL